MINFCSNDTQDVEIAYPYLFMKKIYSFFNDDLLIYV